MSKPQPGLPESVLAAIAASGFPLQTAVSRLIAGTLPYQVLQEEFPWQDRSGNDQFLDIIAEHGAAAFTIECKKSETQSWIFLRPDGSASRDTSRARCIFSRQIQDSSRRLELFCGDWIVRPASFESKFCIVSTGPRGGDQRLIEPDAQRLLRATDVYAELMRSKFQPGPLDELDKPLLPMIVTTARMFVAHYDTKQIPLASGRLEIEPAGLMEVKWIRFRKTFSSSRQVDVGERTILVVGAQHLEELLAKLEIPLRPGPSNPIQMPRLA